MSVDSLDELLEQLNGGAPDAAEQAFLAYEPYLRKVVRRLLPRPLRAKFDSIDVVQSVYCDVLAAFRRRGAIQHGPAAPGIPDHSHAESVCGPCEAISHGGATGTAARRGRTRDVVRLARAAPE